MTARIKSFACTLALASCFWAFTAHALSAQSTKGGVTSNTPAVLVAPAAEEIKALHDETQNLRSEAAKLREESVKLQAQLESQRHETEVFRWMLTIIVGLGVIYGAGQAIFSYLNVQDLKTQAKAAIEDVKNLRTSTADDLETFRTSVRSKSEEDFLQFRKECERAFPMFTGFEKTLGTMALTVKSRLRPPSLNKANVYRALLSQGDLAIEEVYYYEKSAASLQFVEASSPGDMFLILRGLCRFYLDKYRAERDDHTQDPSLPAPNLNDILRAKYYLHRADRLPGGKDFRVSNEYGYIAMLAEVSPDWDRAKAFFTESKQIQPAQQCAYYNLARAAHAKAMDVFTSNPAAAAGLLVEAVTELRFAASQKNWEDSPEIEKGSSVHYNLACALSRWGELTADPEDRQTRLAESYKALEKSVLQAPYARSSFENDCKPNADLRLLSADAIYAPKVAELAKKVKAALLLRTP